MKIGILTIHFGYNYGSVLQSFALNRYLNNQGMNAFTIDYIPERCDFWRSYFPHGNKSIVFRFAINLLKFPSKFLMNNICYYFFRRNVIHTEKITDKNKLSNLNRKFDLFLVGSDQVWNYVYNQECQNVYYLNFTNRPKISYAASFGMDSIDEEYVDELRQKLQEFNFISVREDSAVSIVNALGIPCTRDIDPVFLLEKDSWREFAGRKSRFSRYVFVYALGGEEKSCIDYAFKIAKNKGLKVVVLCFKRVIDKRVDRIIMYASPKRFVQLIRDADFVVTNSFHGTSFSLILNKQFFVVERSKYNTRIDSILTLTGLQKRKLKMDGSSCFNCEEIDYSTIQPSINLQIDKSKENIKKAIILKENTIER